MKVVQVHFSKHYPAAGQLVVETSVLGVTLTIEAPEDKNSVLFYLKSSVMLMHTVRAPGPLVPSYFAMETLGIIVQIHVHVTESGEFMKGVDY